MITLSKPTKANLVEIHLKRSLINVDAFAEHPLTDGSHLIPRSALLDAVEDDDDIDWPEDPFDRPDSASPKSPDKLLAMIHFEGSPVLQDALRVLYHDIFDTAVRPLPTKVDAMISGLEGWPIPNIQQALSRLRTLKPTVFGLLDFTAGYIRHR